MTEDDVLLRRIEALGAEVAKANAEHEGLRSAALQMVSDYQTSEHHHPNHVLVPLAAFKAMQDAITAKGSGE